MKPLSFLIGNTQFVQDSIRELFTVIDLYQKAFPNPGKDLEESIEALDLEFLRDDIPRLFSSIQLGFQSVEKAVKQLRGLSSTDYISTLLQTFDEQPDNPTRP